MRSLPIHQPPHRGEFAFGLQLGDVLRLYRVVGGIELLRKSGGQGPYFQQVRLEGLEALTGGLPTRAGERERVKLLEKSPLNGDSQQTIDHVRTLLL